MSSYAQPTFPTPGVAALDNTEDAMVVAPATLVAETAEVTLDAATQAKFPAGHSSSVNAEVVATNSGTLTAAQVAEVAVDGTHIAANASFMTAAGRSSTTAVENIES